MPPVLVHDSSCPRCSALARRLSTVPVFAELEHRSFAEFPNLVVDDGPQLILESGAMGPRVLRGWRMRMWFARHLGFREWRLALQLLQEEQAARQVIMPKMGLARRTALAGFFGFVAVAVGAAPASRADSRRDVSATEITQSTPSAKQLDAVIGRFNRLSVAHGKVDCAAAVRLESQDVSAIAVPHKDGSFSIAAESDADITLNYMSGSDGSVRITALGLDGSLIIRADRQKSGILVSREYQNSSKNSPDVGVAGINNDWLECMEVCGIANISPGCVIPCGIAPTWFGCACLGFEGIKCAIKCRHLW